MAPKQVTRRKRHGILINYYEEEEPMVDNAREALKQRGLSLTFMTKRFWRALEKVDGDVSKIRPEHFCDGVGS